MPSLVPQSLPCPPGPSTPPHAHLVPQLCPMFTWSLSLPFSFFPSPDGAQPFTGPPLPAPSSDTIPCLTPVHYLLIIPYLLLHGL